MSNFFDRIYRIDRIENFYRRARKERRDKIVQSLNPILKILEFLNAEAKLSEILSKKIKLEPKFFLNPEPRTLTPNT